MVDVFTLAIPSYISNIFDECILKISCNRKVSVVYNKKNNLSLETIKKAWFLTSSFLTHY